MRLAFLINESIFSSVLSPALPRSLVRDCIGEGESGMAFWVHLRKPRLVWRFMAFAKSLPDPVSGTTQPLRSRAQTNPSAFEAFFWRYERLILAYLCRMTHDEQVASDLCQETFFRAWQHFDAIREGAQGRSWLFRVATNLALHHLRHARKHLSIPLDEEALPGASDPGGRIIEQDLINQTLSRLTDHQRSALLLHEVYGLECDEIASMLGISRAAVKMALWRARQQFRIHYLREGGAV
jgi:RNA polymerase sigma-70 factor, ECF subfamily